MSFFSSLLESPFKFGNTIFHGGMTREATKKEKAKGGYNFVYRSENVFRYMKSKKKLHRTDGPAYMSTQPGEKFEWWYKDGKLHRIGGPAKTGQYMSDEWWVNGKRHRTDGPAVTPIKEYPISKWNSERFYVNGKEITREEFEKHFDIKESKFRTIVEMTEQSYWFDPKTYSMKKGTDHEVMVQKDPEWFGLIPEDLDGMPPKAVALQAGFVRIDIFPNWAVFELPKRPDNKLKDALSYFVEQMYNRYLLKGNTKIEVYVYTGLGRPWIGVADDLHSTAIFEGLTEDKIDKQIKTGKITGNPNSRELMKILKKLGAKIELRGNDDYKISHPLMDNAISMSAHRKSTPWGVIDWINKLIKKKRTKGEL